MENPSTIRVLLVDDHLVVRMGLRSLIESEPDMTVASEASNGHEALEQYQRGGVNAALR